MGQETSRAYGLGLSRDRHIAFAAAYVAVLVTIGGFGVARYVQHLPALNLSRLMGRTAAGSQIAFRAHPVPDPAFPHAIAFYPHVALLNRQEGVVIVRLLILQDGQVGDVSLVRSSGYPQLDAAALIGTGEWRYLPAIRDGAPVSAEIDVAIRFRLQPG